MANKPKILFVYDHPNPTWWLDGLSAALSLLEEDFEVTKWNIKDPQPKERHSCDFILGWGAFGSSVDTWLQQQREDGTELGCKKGLCIAGNALPPKGADNYDVLFYETDWIKNNYLPKHPNTVKAFGVNTDIYHPVAVPLSILWDYLGVGAFALWKRWDRFADKQGNRLVLGEYQLDNEHESLSIIRHLIQEGVACGPAVFPLELQRFYHATRTVYIPADIMGGGERAVLEARSCGCEVEVEPDNPKLQELVEGSIPSHVEYATALKMGIESVL